MANYLELDAKSLFAVYPGSERIDLGPKRVAVICTSEDQAKHMVKFWAPYGYYELLLQEEKPNA